MDVGFGFFHNRYLKTATALSGAIRSGNQVDARVLQIANQIAQQQQRQLTDSQRTQASAPTWAMGEEEPADSNFRRID